MQCENCGAFASRAARFCRHCGGALSNSRLPVKRTPVYPTIWQHAAPVVVRGVALMALGVAAEMALTALAKGALRLPALRLQAKKKRPLPAKMSEQPPEGSYAVSETFIMRRLIMRR